MHYWSGTTSGDPSVSYYWCWMAFLQALWYIFKRLINFRLINSCEKVYFKNVEFLNPFLQKRLNNMIDLITWLYSVVDDQCSVLWINKLLFPRSRCVHKVALIFISAAWRGQRRHLFGLFCLWLNCSWFFVSMCVYAGIVLIEWGTFLKAPCLQLHHAVLQSC